MVTVIIDGHHVEAEAGTTILTVAERLGIDIPTFCYQKRLPVLASCRMCLVEIEGQGKLHPSCAMTVTDGMVVHTNSPRVVDTRAFMLDMLLANHPLDCPICDKGGECELQDMVMAYGPRVSRFRDEKRVFHSKDIRLSPVIIMNENRCIQCQRCVRMCEEVVGAVALGTVDKGMDTAITGFAGSLASCDQCGNCIEVCPVGALMSFPYRYKARPWDLVETDTICPHCGTGCQLTVGARNGEFMRVRSKWDHGINLETLCARGRFGLDFVASTDRVKRPMIRQNGALVPVSWNDAGAHLRARLSDALASGKPAAGLASPRLTSEALYQFQKLMRTVFRTNDIDSSCRWSAPFDALASLVGEFYARAPLDDVILADCVLVVGSNVNEENPVTEYLLRGAARNRHTALHILSTRPSRLDADARSAIRVPPAGEATILAALAARLCTLAEPPADTALDRLAAALSGAAAVTLLAGTDLLRSPDPAASFRALHWLARSLRALDKTVAVQLLFDRPNQLGAWDLGVLPDALPGLHTVADAATRGRLEQAWGAAIPDSPGAGLDRMLQLCAAGSMGALYLAGADPLLSYPDRARVRQALDSVDLVIVQDTFLTDTAGAADVVLPAAGYGEESGTFVNNEGRTQRVDKFRAPPFEARTNLEILSFVAALRGHTLDPSPAAVFDEIARLVPSFGRLTYDGLGVDGAFTSSRRQPSGGAPAMPAVPAPVRQDGLVLITGNCLFHSGYLTERSEIIRSIADDPFAEMNPEDADALGLHAQDLIEVRSPRGTLRARLKLTRGFPHDIVFVPENYRSLQLNSLMQAGEYPCPVQVRLAPAEGEAAPAAQPATSA